MNNKKVGSDFERRYAIHLKKCGFWVHFLNPAPDGSQPFDFIALKGTVPQIIAADCKTCSGNRFPLSRVEDNQVTAFTQLAHCGLAHCGWFVIETRKNHVISIPAEHVLQAKRNGITSINLKEYDENGYSTDIE